jgi:hypothetical protein
MGMEERKILGGLKSVLVDASAHHIVSTGWTCRMIERSANCQVRKYISLTS